MNDIDGVVNGPKSTTTEPRCHSDDVDPLVFILLYKSTQSNRQMFNLSVTLDTNLIVMINSLIRAH